MIAGKICKETQIRRWYDNTIKWTQIDLGYLSQPNQGCGYWSELGYMSSHFDIGKECSMMMEWYLRSHNCHDHNSHVFICFMFPVRNIEQFS